METNDPRVKTKVLDGQVLYFPTPEAWAELEKYPVFGGRKIPVTDIIFPKVKWTSRFKELQSATSVINKNPDLMDELPPYCPKLLVIAKL